MAPTIEPADVPETRWMPYPASISATTAPDRPMPLTPPPDRTRSAFSGLEVMCADCSRYGPPDLDGGCGLVIAITVGTRFDVDDPWRRVGVDQRDDRVVAPGDVVTVGGLGHRRQVQSLDRVGFAKQYRSAFAVGGLFDDFGQCLKLPNHDGGHADCGLADGVERALDKSVEIGDERDHADVALRVAPNPLRTPRGGDPAEAVGNPVDTRHSRERVVDRWGQRAQGDLD